jgi:hypothetical protein
MLSPADTFVPSSSSTVSAGSATRQREILSGEFNRLLVLIQQR